MKKVLLSLFIFILFNQVNIFAQNNPPAQGPPPAPQEDALGISLKLLVDLTKSTIQTILDSANAKILRESGSTNVKAHLSFTSKMFKPRMTTTQYTDRPNQNLVIVPVMVDYTISGIKWHSIPYFSRKMFQSIDIYVSCENWFTKDGNMHVLFDNGPINMDQDSWSESALNFFFANTISNFVSGRIRDRLPAINNTEVVLNSPCNCLSVEADEENDYEDSEAKFKFVGKKFGISDAIQGRGVSITFQSIERLRARDLGSVLYDSVENVAFEVFVNQTSRYVEFSDFREGEIRTLNLNPVLFPKPGNNASVVIIGNAIQQGLFRTDTRFTVFKKDVRFGNGTQSLIVRKAYTIRPQYIPGVGYTKPSTAYSDAYKINYTIDVPQELLILDH
ncbi:MAG: hypothetical protein ABI528_06145 [bacterium]